MKFSILTAFFILLLASSVLTSKAQNYTVKGTVVDSAGLPLPGALVRINWGTDSTGNASNMDGSFQLSQVKSRAFMLSVDRKSTRLNSSHVKSSYAVFCLKKKTASYGTRSADA